MSTYNTAQFWDDAGNWDDTQNIWDYPTVNVLETAVVSGQASGTDIVRFLDTSAVVSNPEAQYFEVYSTVDSIPAVITSSEASFVTAYEHTDTAVVLSNVTSSRTTKVSLLERASLNDTVYPAALQTYDVSEVAVVTDSAFVPTPRDDVLDTAVLSDSFTAQASRVANLLDTFYINDYPATGTVVDVLDSAVVIEAISSYLTSDTTITETAVLEDYITTQESLSATISDAVQINDSVTSYVTANTLVTDQLFINDEVYIPVDNTDSIVFTANTVNWAMSRYVSAPLITKAGMYAITPEGLFEQTTEYADSSIETGFTDFKSPQLKSVQYAYVYSEHENPATITATGDVNGEEYDYEYIQMARSASDTRSVRCQLGRGFRSNYFKLRIDSDGYVKTQYCLPVVEELSRRI